MKCDFFTSPKTQRTDLYNLKKLFYFFLLALLCDILNKFELFHISVTIYKTSTLAAFGTSHKPRRFHCKQSDNAALNIHNLCLYKIKICNDFKERLLKLYLELLSLIQSWFGPKCIHSDRPWKLGPELAGRATC